MRRWVAAIVLSCVAATAPSCVGAPEPRSRLVVGITDRPFSGIVAIADVKGMFADNGLDVDVRKMDEPRARLSAMTSGAIDIAHGPDFAFATHSFESTAFRIIAQTSHAVDHQVAVRKGSGIREPADLAGRRIAVGKGSGTEFVLQRILANVGLSETDVTIVHASAREAPELLADGRVDAIITFSPLRAKAAEVLAGKAEYWPLPEEGVKTWSLLGVSAITARRREKDLEAFVRSLVQAQRWAEENPDEALAVVRAWSGEPRAYPDGWPAGELYIALSKQLEVRLDEEMAWISRAHREPMPARGAEILDPDPLFAVDPSLVSISER